MVEFEGGRTSWMFQWGYVELMDTVNEGYAVCRMYAYAVCMHKREDFQFPKLVSYLSLSARRLA